jgi:hypothetical protein
MAMPPSNRPASPAQPEQNPKPVPRKPSEPVLTPKPKPPISPKPPTAKPPSNANAAIRPTGDTSRLIPLKPTDKTASGRPTAQSGPQKPPRAGTSVALHRQKLGLSSAKLSDRVSGLDKFVKQQDQKRTGAEDRRRQRGQINRTTAIFVDETGNVWARKVRLLIFSTALLAVLSFLFLMFIRRPETDHAAAAQETVKTLKRLRDPLSIIRPFNDSELPTPEKVIVRLEEVLRKRLDQLERQRKQELEARGAGASSLQTELNQLRVEIGLKDGWGVPWDVKIISVKPAAVSLKSLGAESAFRKGHIPEELPPLNCVLPYENIAPASTSSPSAKATTKPKSEPSSPKNTPNE